MMDDEIGRARRLCYFAHYHPTNTVADYVVYYLSALRDAGFTVVVLSTADLPITEQAKLSAACARLVMRPNVGLDFGGWMEAFARFPPQEAEFLLLANDSVYAPIGDLSAFVDRLTAAPADFYGAVESTELGPHLQSWFLLLRPTAYRSDAFRRLMTEPIPRDLPKMDIIRRYEWGLTERLAAAGLTHRAGWSPNRAGPIAKRLPFNPTHMLWRALIVNKRIPFLKVELLRDNPTRIAGVAGWRRVVRARAPALVPMIEADAAARGARPIFRLFERFHWSVELDRFIYWPDLHHWVVRDTVARTGLTRRLNDCGFVLAHWLGQRWRWRVIERRRRRG